MATSIVAPLTGTVTTTAFTPADYAVPGVQLPSGKPFHYEIMMPSQYSTNFLWPLMIWLHPDTSGNAWYEGQASTISVSDAAPQYQNVAFQRAYPCICIVPYADQTTDSDAIENWGGWVNTGGTGNGTTFNGETGPNTFALNGLVQHLTATLAVDPNRVYVNGFSLGGIGAEYFMLRYNQVNGNPKLYTAGTSTGGVLEIHGYGAGPTSADITTMAQVPVWWISGQNDGTSNPADWNLPMWRDQSGNTNYPAYLTSAAASLAGSSKMHFWYVSGVGHSPVDNSGNYMEANPTVLNWLFAQGGTSATTAPSPPPQAVAAGLNKLAFSDDFTTNTFATSANQSSGANWYYSFSGNAPQTVVNPTMTAAQLSNGNTGGGNNASPNGGIASILGVIDPVHDAWLSVPGGFLNNGGAVQPAAGAGNWQHFYVEIYTQFNINTSPTNGTWPSFWSWSLEALHQFGFGSSSLSESDLIELDFYESFGSQNFGNAAGVLESTLHHWTAAGGNPANAALLLGYPAHGSNPVIPAVAPFFDNNWHTIGCLWIPDPNNAGQGLVSMYVDNVQYGTIVSTGGAGSTYPLENQHLFLIMPGAGGSPTYVDWVRVWQSGTGGGGGGGGSGGGTGEFVVKNGQIIGPNGAPWLPMGIDMHQDNLSALASGSNSVFNTFPGTNYVRVACGDYEGFPAPSSLAAAVTTLTNAGIVLEFSDYSNSLGTGSGGGQGNIFTGSLLTNESAWFASMATYYINNPYVWFGTNNEPALIYPGNSNATATGSQSLSAWQKATYNAVRGTGNTNPILLEPGGDAVGNFRGGQGIPMMQFQDPAVVATMTNVIWDPHIYGYMNNYATDAATNNLLVSLVIQACQAVTSADGVVPCIIGEYGPEGANGVQIVTAILLAGTNGVTGSAAWVWDQDGEVGGPSGDPTGLTQWGLLSGGVITTQYGAPVAAAILTNSQKTVTPPTFTVSSNNTVVLAGSTAKITDTNGTTFGIVGGQVSISGVTDTTTSGVVELAFVNSVVWYKNSSGNWYSRSGSAWAGPTTVSPLPTVSPSGSFVIAPSTSTLTDAAFNIWGISTAGRVTENASTVTTPGGAVVITPSSGGSIQDGTGNTWTLTSGGIVMENGAVANGGSGTGSITVFGGVLYAQDSASGTWYNWNGTTFVQAASAPVTTTAVAVIELAYVNALIWEKDATNNWYSTNPATSPIVWTGPTTTSPLSSVPGGLSYILPMFQAGLRVITYIKQEAPASFVTGLASLRAEQSSRHDIAMYEGCQEPDTAVLTGTQETLASAGSFQQTVFSAGQADGIPVIQTSFGVAADYGTTGNLAAFATYGNAHTYMGSTLNCAPNDGPSPGFLSTLTTDALLTSPGLAVAHTEFGWRNSNNSPTAVASYVLDFIMSGYFDLNLPLMIAMGLYDDASGNFGLFNPDQTPRLVATALSNFFTLLKDSAANSLSFGPGKLNIAISNLPTGTNPNMGGHFGVLQKASGEFWVLVRNEQTLTTTDANNHVPVAVAALNCIVTLGTLATSITVYDPVLGVTAVQTAVNTSSVTVSVPAHPILIKIVRP
jgi:hypothetical protein